MKEAGAITPLAPRAGRGVGGEGPEPQSFQAFSHIECALAGGCPAASDFLLFAQEKVTKEKGTPLHWPSAPRSRQTQAGQRGNSLRFNFKGSEARTSALLLTGLSLPSAAASEGTIKVKPSPRERGEGGPQGRVRGKELNFTPLCAASAGWLNWGPLRRACLSTWPRSGSCEFASRPIQAAGRGLPRRGGPAGAPSFGSLSWQDKKGNLLPGNPRPNSANDGNRTVRSPTLISHALALVIAASLALASSAYALPSFETVKAQHRPSEAWLLDRHGQRLHTLRIDNSVRRLPWVRLEALSPAMQEALIASEDKRFYQHGGVDWKAVLGAMWDHLLTDSTRGASTLTMQLAAMLDPNLTRAADGRNYTQKWNQMQAARELEHTWSKPRILEAYLNTVQFRGELSGIGAASWGLFQKHPSGLNKAEASLLAALLRGPNATPDKVAERACDVANKLSQPRPVCKAITSLAWSTLVVRPRIPFDNQIAPHLARQLLKQPGQIIQTSLDANLQGFVLANLQQHLAELKDRNVEDGAVIVLDNASGQVLAYVGSSLTTSDAPEVDGVRAPRLPGSTLKPFLYALAIEQRVLTAASLLDDSPLSVETAGGQYLPQNYDHDFKGWISLRTALGSSLNVPAVRTLVLLGYEPFYDRLKQIGLSTLTRNADYYGYSLALGGAEVTLLDLANAYRSLANGGNYSPLRLSRERGAGGEGDLRGRGTANQRRVFSPAAAWIVSDILADREARALTFGLDNALSANGWAAVKTGTSKDMRDNWCIGFSDRYTVGVWVGNASGEPMHDVSGVTGAAPVWQAIMKLLHQGKPGIAPALPKNVRIQTVKFEPAVEPLRREAFIKGTEMSLVSLPQGSTANPRIVGPGNGAILALDPDIPAGRQSVHFSARPPRADLSWQVDNAAANPEADGSLHWQPVPGVHTILLLDAQNKPLDETRLVVRGKLSPVTSQR
jgi:penicillin-binding protein 1C